MSDQEPESDPPRRFPQFLRRFRQLLMGILIGIFLAGAVLAFLSVRICDDQVTNDGRVVKVCRHLGAADPPVPALGLILVALLSFFYSEIQGFGFTLKREIRETRRVADAAHATSLQNRQDIGETKKVALQNKQDIGETESDLKEVSSQVFGQQGPAEALAPAEEQPEPAEPSAPIAEDPVIAKLAQDYNRIRLTMPRSAARTRAMTDIVNQMRSYFEGVESFDLASRLNSSDRGLRLAAYVYLYARPDPSWTSALVASLLDKEDKPFGQYWALLALERQCDRHPAALGRDDRRRLDTFLEELPEGTDRAVALQRVLRGCSP
jgi:hypothetical protein